MAQKRKRGQKASKVGQDGPQKRGKRREERPMGSPSAAISLIRHFFTQTWSLEDYLRLIIVEPGLDRYDGENLPQGVLVAKSVMAGVSAGGSTAPAVTLFKLPIPGSTLINQAEVLSHVHKRLFDRQIRQDLGWKGPPNVLATGYRLTRTSSSSASHHPDYAGRLPNALDATSVVMEWPNSAVEELKSRAWDNLLQMVGEDVMLHLLEDCSLFRRFGGDCWVQLAGQSIMELKELRNTHCDKRVARKNKTPAAATTSKNALSTINRKASQTVFVRSRIFYNREHMSEHKASGRQADSQKSFPLSKRHVFQRIDGSKDKIKTDAVHLLKYIFPKQFKLHNVFTSATDYSMTSQPLMDYADREQEIRRMPARPIPKRVKPFYKTVVYILKQHRKCHYVQALDYFCPASHDVGHLMDEDEITTVTEASTPALASTQLLAISMATPSSCTTMRSQLRSEQALKPRFAEHTTAPKLVSFFVRSILRYILPTKIFGSRWNLDLIMSKVDRFVRLRRYESLTLHEVMQDFHIKDCIWAAAAVDPRAEKQRTCLSDFTKQVELVSEVIYWMFDSLLMPLLTANFYITESSAYKNRTLYFRHDTWYKISRPIIHQLSESLFRQLERTELDAFMTHRKLGYSFVRLLPKESGVRPIINLRRRIAKRLSKLGPSINSVLQPLSAVLNSIKINHPSALGSSCFGLNDIYSKLKGCQSRMLDRPETQKLYFVKLDIKACYDRIVQDTLLQLVNELIENDEYLIQKFAALHKVANKVKRRYLLRAYGNDSDYPQFSESVVKEAKFVRHTVFVDSIIYSHKYREDLLDLIDEHITRNAVKIGDRFFQQTVGIPQGSILSSLLCSLHFGDMENKHLSYVSDIDSQLLRLIDDFLFITTDQDKAVRFLQQMHEGFPKYGCTISPDKTLCNFGIAINGYKVAALSEQESSFFPWCGLLIDTQTLAIRAECSRFAIGRMSDSLTIETARSQGEAFLNKMKHSIKQRLHRIFIDMHLNGRSVVLENIHTMMIIVGMKLCAYTRTGSNSAATFLSNEPFLVKASTSLVNYCASCLISQTAAMGVRDPQKVWHKPEIDFVCWEAFSLVIARKQSRFPQLLKFVCDKAKMSRLKFLNEPQSLKELDAIVNAAARFNLVSLVTY